MTVHETLKVGDGTHRMTCPLPKSVCRNKSKPDLTAWPFLLSWSATSSEKPSSSTTLQPECRLLCTTSGVTLQASLMQGPWLQGRIALAMLRRASLAGPDAGGANTGVYSTHTPAWGIQSRLRLHAKVQHVRENLLDKHASQPVAHLQSTQQNSFPRKLPNVPKLKGSNCNPFCSGRFLPGDDLGAA